VGGLTICQKTRKEQTVKEYELYEFRPGRFVKVLDGKVVGPASIGEVHTYRWRHQHEDVSPGMIEVSLAIAAVSAVLATQLSIFVFRIVAAVTFAMSVVASALLYAAYIIPKIPIAWTHFLRSKFRGTIWIWLVWYYPVQLYRAAFRSTRVSFEEQTTELGYLTLLAALALMEMTLVGFVAESFL